MNPHLKKKDSGDVQRSLDLPWPENRVAAETVLCRSYLCGKEWPCAGMAREILATTPEVAQDLRATEVVAKELFDGARARATFEERRLGHAAAVEWRRRFPTGYPVGGVKIGVIFFADVNSQSFLGERCQTCFHKKDPQQPGWQKCGC